MRDVFWVSIVLSKFLNIPKKGIIKNYNFMESEKISQIFMVSVQIPL